MASASVRQAGARACAGVDAGARARIARRAVGTTSRSRRMPSRLSGGASTRESAEYVRSPAGSGEVVPIAALSFAWWSRESAERGLRERGRMKWYRSTVLILKRFLL